MKLLPSRLIILIIVVTGMVYASFTSTYLISESTYEALISGLSGGEAAVWGRRARTPITGIIPAEAVELLQKAHGVDRLSPEVISPCIVEGKTLIARGVQPDLFLNFQEVKILEGRFIQPNRLEAALGARLSRRLSLPPGCRVAALSIFNNRWVELDIIGIISTGTSIDDEMIIPIEVARWLRGLSGGQLTLIRVGTRPDIQPPEEIGETLTEWVNRLKALYPNETTTRGLLNPSELSAGEAEEFSRRLLERELGFTEDSLKLLSILVSLFALLLSSYTSHTAISGNGAYISLLRALGSSKRGVLRISTQALLKASILGIILGLGLTILIIQAINSLDITILGYALKIIPTYKILIVSSLAVSASNIAGGIKALGEILSRPIVESLQPPPP